MRNAPFFVPMVHITKYLKHETKHVSRFSCNFAPKNKQRVKTLPKATNKIFLDYEDKVIFHLSYICLSAWCIDGTVALSEPCSLGSRESSGSLWSTHAGGESFADAG